MRGALDARYQAGLRTRIAIACCRWYPFYSGCGTFANSRVVRFLAGAGSDTVWSRLPCGCAIQVSLDDYDGWSVYAVGDVDRKITWICERIVRPGDRVIDIGANVGLVTLSLARLVGISGRVWSFEPNPVLADRLAASLSRNDFEHVELHACALGNANTDLCLVVPKGHSGRGSVVRSFMNRPCERISVPVRRLADVIPPTVHHLRLLKIDVEGAEPAVFAGSQDLFARTPPDAVLFELNDVGDSASSHPSVVFLRERGYIFFAIPKALLRMRVLPFDPDRDRMVGHDLLACRGGLVADEIGGSLGVRRRVPGGKRVNLA